MANDERRVVVAVDIGGTFTDVVTQDLATKEISHRKVSTTTGEPADGIVRGVQKEIENYRPNPQVTRFLHGTTIATNALIEGNGVAVGLLLNAGLRGVAQMQSGAVGEKAHPRGQRPRPLVSEQDIYEIPGRLDRNGGVLEELDEQAVRVAAKSLAASAINSVGVCYIFSFLNPTHEQRTREILLEEHPTCTVLTSVDILPRVREWPRCSTLLLSSYLEPIMVNYISSLRQALSEIGIPENSQFIMESNGGIMSFSSVVSGGRSIHTLLSGPAAAVQAAHRISEATGLRNLVTMDIGGTSCDIAFVEGGTPLEVTSGQVSGYDLYVPMLDISTIGAGGGTIARVTDDGRLMVGPDSAGAVPGPAAYGRGGRQATTTDADVVLGYLDPNGTLAGEISISEPLAREVVEDNVARPLGITVEEAALGIQQINDAHMANAIRVVAERKGLDLGECTLVACGGAGPLHAGFIAEELSMPRILVPLSPGVFSALGLLCSDIYHDYVQSVLARLENLDAERITAAFETLKRRARADLEKEGFSLDEIGFFHELDARYGGQGHEIRVPLPAGSGVDVDLIREAFHTEHERINGTSARAESVEIVSYRLRAFVVMPKYEPLSIERGDDETPSPIKVRSIRCSGEVVEADVWSRSQLVREQVVFGPSIIEQADTTVLIAPGWEGVVDEFGNLLISKSSR